MVGRDAELSLLLQAFGLARSGEAQIAVVAGDGGIGKTRLIREFLARLPEGTLVAFGHAVPLSGYSLPYGVIADLLRSLIREIGIGVVRDVLGDRANILAPLVPRLGEGATDQVDRLALFAATQDLLDELLTQGAVVLVVEDVHWADESSLDLLTVWARRLVRGPLVLVLTTRESGIDERVLERTNEMSRLSHATVLTLGPLDRHAVVDQLRGLEANVADDTISAIQHLSEGVPLYVEELLMARHSGVPSAIRTDMAARLRSLEPGAGRLLQIAAVEPRPFTSASLAVVASADRDIVDAAVDAAVAAGLLDSVDRGWRFSHELLRRGAAESLTPSARLLAHEAWADHLSASSTPDDLVTAAMHRAELGSNRASFLGYLAAAKAATSIAPGREAQNLWRRALEVVRDAPGSASEAEHDEVLGVAATLLNNVVDYRALADIEEASSVAPTGLRREFTRLCRWIVADTLPDEVGSVPEPGRADLTSLSSRLDREPSTPLTFATLLMLLEVLDRKRLLAERDAAVEILASHAAGLPDQPSGIDWVTEWRLFTVSGFDHEEERLDLARAAVQRSIDRDWATRVWAYTAWATELREAADLAGAVEQSQRAFEMVTSTREQHWYLIAACRIEALRLQGCWDDALGLVDRLRTRGTLDSHWWLGTMHRLLIARARGQHDAVSETADEMWHKRFPPGSGMHSDEVGLMTALAMAIAHVSDRGHVASLVTMIEATDPRYVWLYADAVAFAAEQTWATDLVSDAQRAAIRRATERLDDTSLARLWQTEILAHLRRAEAGDDPDMWRDSVVGWERAGAPYLAARSRTRLAETLLVDDDRNAASEALGRALSVAEGLEAIPLADEIRTLASRTRLHLPGRHPASPGSTGPLTVREHEVLQLLVQGMTNDQIGAALFISPKTASVHVSHILSKLGATNRTEATATAHRLGLVSGA